MNPSHAVTFTYYNLHDYMWFFAIVSSGIAARISIGRQHRKLKARLAVKEYNHE